MTGLAGSRSIQGEGRMRLIALKKLDRNGHENLTLSGEGCGEYRPTTPRYRFAVVLPWPVIAVCVHGEVEEVVNPNRVVEFPAVERAILHLEPQPEKCSETLVVNVNSARIRLAGDTLQEQQSAWLLNEPLSSRLADAQEFPQNLPAAAVVGDPEILHGHYIVNIQAA